MRVTHHLWTLTRSGKITHCTVVQRSGSGTWALRLTCNGRRILDASFASLAEAISQSSITFGALLTRGWFGDTDLAGPGGRTRRQDTAAVH